MAGGPPALPPEITSLLFFYDNFKNSDEAAEYVVEQNKGPGTFLLRPSTRNPSSLTLTISIENRHARHVNVQRLPDIQSATGYTFFIIPERPFPTFRELYAYYTRNAICNLEQVNNVKLLNPLNRPQQPGASSQRSSRNNSFSQQLLPGEIPPLPSRKSSNSSNMSVNMPDVAVANGRSSFGSGGNATPRTSGSSTGSANGAEGLSYYFAPGSPGSPGSLKSPTSPIPPPLPTPLTKKDIKKLEKQKKKEDKEREKEEKKARKEEKKSRKMNGDMMAEVNNMGELGWCRPPMPTPAASDSPNADDEPPYYSSPRPYKNHLEELKRMLRESEICDCGLKMIDAELVGGWTVHRSRESATFKRVFYQHENGSTTWNFPTDIEDLLSVQQVDFIVRLCSEAGQPIPDPVYRRYQAIKTASESRRSYMDQYGPRPGPQF